MNNPKQSVRDLVALGATEKAAEEVHALSLNCHSMDDVLRSFGPPNETVNWESDVMSHPMETPVNTVEWKVCYVYRKWEPLYVMALEGKDGALSFAFMVSKPKPAPPR